MNVIDDLARVHATLARAVEHSQSAAADLLALQPPRLLGDPLADAARAIEGSDRLRVLVYSADMGGGHDAMANAIKGELLTRYPGQVDVDVANGLKIGNPIAHRLMRDGYAAQLRFAPDSYGALYSVLTNPTVSAVTDSLTGALTARRLAADIARRDPDVVVSTFPGITSTLGHMRDDGKLGVEAIGTVIDSDPHRMWVSPGVDQHVVLNPRDLPRIERFGTPDRPIVGRAIRPPVDLRSFEHYDVAAAREHFGLPTDRKVLLVSGGSWGLALPDAQLQRILRDTDLHLAIATGRNEQALAHLKATYPADRVTGIPFTKDMPMLLAASDGMITNSSGMTTMEGFARGRPIVLYRPVPGHGEHGAAALHADGLATYATSADEAIAALRRIESGDDADLAARVARARSMFEDGEQVSDIVIDAARRGRAARSGAA